MYSALFLFHYSSDTFVLHVVGVTIGIEEPRVVKVTEGVNLTVGYCVVITAPNMSTTIESDDFFVCVSTVDGTAVGKNIGHRSRVFYSIVKNKGEVCCIWQLNNGI